jgi:sulfite reductase beta subunit-like hemoprotein
LSGADERLRAKAESAILISRMTNEERMQRESNLIATIRKKLPDFARMCADDAELVMLHQDAFAADYQEDEYMLLGMAIKYAGLRGKEVRVIGRNRSTLGEEDKIH